MDFAPTQRRNQSGEWEDVAFEDLKVGDVFRQQRDGNWEQPFVVNTSPDPCEPPGNFGLTATAVEV